MATYSSYPSQDTYLNNSAGNTNYGGATTLPAFNDGGGWNRRAIFQWDLSSVPVVAKISNVNMMFHQVGAGAGPTEYIYRVRRAWAEYSATWNSPWASGGCWNTSTDYDSSAIGSFTQAADSDRNVSISASVITDWLTGTFANNGVLMDTSSGGSGFCEFGSRDNGTAGYRPVLSFDWDIPVPPGMMIVGLFRQWQRRTELYRELMHMGAIPLGGQELKPI